MLSGDLKSFPMAPLTMIPGETLMQLSPALAGLVFHPWCHYMHMRWPSVVMQKPDDSVILCAQSSHWLQHQTIVPAVFPTCQAVTQYNHSASQTHNVTHNKLRQLLTMLSNASTRLPLCLETRPAAHYLCHGVYMLN